MQDGNGRRGAPGAGAAAVLAAGAVLAALIWSVTFYRARTLDNSMSVTGSVRRQVTSDVVKWRGQVQRTVPVAGVAPGYALMERDRARFLAFLRERGIAETAVQVSPLFADPVYSRDSGAPAEYNLRQTFALESRDIAGVTKLANDAAALLTEGVLFATTSLEYYYTGLPELRIELLAGALEDARARARIIAEAAGSRLGGLRSASAGVTQVLQPNSMEVSDWGTYDTSTVEKEVAVTVRAQFVLR